MDDPKTCDWDDITLSEVQFVALRARGSDRAGRQIQVTYDRGSVLVTENVDASTATTRVLRLREIRRLLEALRAQSRVMPRAKAVDSAALRAMVGALARIVHSPGAIPFGATSFGTIRQNGDAIVGHVDVEPGRTACIRDVNGELFLETSKPGATGRFSRRLSIAQLRALIAALQTRTNAATDTDDLWVKVRDDAQRREEAIRVMMDTARGHRFASKNVGSV